MGGLHEAIKSLDISKVKSILQSGVDINEINEYGATALNWATFYNIEIVKLLIFAGADVNAADKKGMTPLMNAATWNIKLK